MNIITLAARKSGITLVLSLLCLSFTFAGPNASSDPIKADKKVNDATKRELRRCQEAIAFAMKQNAVLQSKKALLMSKLETENAKFNGLCKLEYAKIYTQYQSKAKISPNVLPEAGTQERLLWLKMDASCMSAYKNLDKMRLPQVKPLLDQIAELESRLNDSHKLVSNLKQKVQDLNTKEETRLASGF